MGRSGGSNRQRVQIYEDDSEDDYFKNDDGDDDYEGERQIMVNDHCNALVIHFRRVEINHLLSGSFTCLVLNVTVSFIFIIYDAFSGHASHMNP